jgi:hypothetical protein
MAYNFAGIEGPQIAALLREAAAELRAANTRADAAEARCESLSRQVEELRLDKERIVAQFGAEVQASEQSEGAARHQLSVAEADAKSAEERAMNAERRAATAENNVKQLADCIRALEGRLERIRAALDFKAQEPSLDDVVSFVAQAMSEPDDAENEHRKKVA